MILENDVILSGLSVEIILNCKPEYIKTIYRMHENKKIILFDTKPIVNLTEVKEANANDLKIYYKFICVNFSKIFKKN